jgi:hypothetical protein
LSTTTDNPAGCMPATKKSLRLDWYGQTAASLCWIASVFTYGIDGAGDILQLFAASAWLVANIFTAVTTLKHR